MGIASDGGKYLDLWSYLLHLRRQRRVPPELQATREWHSFDRIADIMGEHCEYLYAICQLLAVNHPNLVQRLMQECHEDPDCQ